MEKDKRKKIIRIILRVFTGFVLGVISLVILFGIYLTTTPGENLIRSIAKSQLEKALNQTVEIGRLQTNLVSHLKLEDISIYRFENDTITPFIKLNELDVTYSLINLILLNLNIHSVKIDSPQVYLLRDSSGFYNLPISASADTAAEQNNAAPMNISLGEMEIEQGTIYYNDRTIPLSGALRHLNINAAGNFLNNFNFDIKSYANQLRYQGNELSVDSLAVNGEWIDQVIKLNSLLLAVPGYTLSGASTLDLKQESPSINGNLELSGSPEPLSGIFREYVPDQLYPVRGDINLSFEMSGNFENPRIAVQINFSQLRLSDMQLRNGNIQATWYNNSLEIEQMKIGLMGGNIDGEGQLILGDTLNHSLDLNVKSIDMVRIWRELYHEKGLYRGQIDGRINSSGPLDDLQSLTLSSELTIQNASFEEKPLPDFMVKANLNQGRANLDIHQAESRITADVKLFDERLSGSFSANINRLEPFVGLVNLMGVKGSINMDGNISGTMESPEVEARFSADSLRYQNLPMDTLYGSFSFIDNQLMVEKCVFNGKWAVIDSSNAPFGLSGLQGGFTYKGKIEGSVENPQAELQLDFHDAGYAGYRINSLSAQVSLSGDTLHVQKLQVDRDSVVIVAAGNYNLSETKGQLRIGLFGNSISAKAPENDSQISSTFDLSDSTQWEVELQGTSVDMDKLTKLLPGTPEMNGNLNFNLNFSGTPDHPNASLNLVVLNPRFQQVAMDSISAKIKLKPNYIYVNQLELVIQGNKSAIEGDFQLRKTAEGYSFTKQNAINISGQGDNIDLRIINPFLTPGMHIAGTSSYRFEIAGDLENPQIDGEFDISDGELQISEDTPPVTEITMNLGARDSLINIEQLSGIIKETPFNLKGKIIASQGFNFTGNIDMSISNRPVLRSSGTIAKENIDYDLKINQFDLSLLQPFVTDIRELNGVANSTIKITGNFSKPTMNGNLSIQNLSFNPQIMDVSVTKGTVKLNLQGNQARLDSLFMQINEGTLTGAGQMVFKDEGFAQLDLHTKIQNVKLEKGSDFLVTVNSARISYKKQNDNYLLNGDVVLGESKLFYNVTPQAILPFTKKVEMPQKETSPVMQQTQLKVRIHDSDNMWIDNNLVRVRLHPEIEIIGTLANPNVSGRISAAEGYLIYLDRKFQIEKGTIDFVDPNRINPIIDLIAVANVTAYNRLEGTAYEITLELSGPLDEVKVKLSSIPPLERADIVALLTVGATRTQLTGRTTNGEQVSTSEILEQRFQTLSTRIISGYAGKKLENLLGLQEVSVQGNIFNRASGPQLVASKRISDKAKLTYTTTVGHLNEQGIRLDYSLSKHFAVEGQTDQQGASSLSLKYKLKFK